MTAHTKDTMLKVVLLCIAAVVASFAVLIPGILIYKFTHGASRLSCLAVFGGYIVSWIAVVLLTARFRERSAAWGTLFGVCFFGLLLLSLRL